MQLLILESYYTGSHKIWCDQIAQHLQATVQIWSMPGRHWKWRMHGAAVHFAQRLCSEKPGVDLILVSSLIDLATLRGLLSARGQGHAPLVLYFHENQITYPWSISDPDLGRRDNHYGFINWTACLAADWICFNSEFHKKSLLNALPGFLKQFPDTKETQFIAEITSKSSVLYPGIEMPNVKNSEIELIESDRRAEDAPLLVWNHRHEYDKNPEDFFQALFRLQDQGIDFQLCVLGESFKRSPAIFDLARQRLARQIVHWGFVDSRDTYLDLLMRCDLLPVTSIHDFYGMSVLEAMAHGVIPLLPDRLSYPEWIPEKMHPYLFYDGNTGLYDSLHVILSNWSKHLILIQKQLNLPVRSSRQALRQAIQKMISNHMWPNLKETYLSETKNIRQWIQTRRGTPDRV